jgi:hypothetical protein
MSQKLLKKADESRFEFQQAYDLLAKDAFSGKIGIRNWKKDKDAPSKCVSVFSLDKKNLEDVVLNLIKNRDENLPCFNTTVFKSDHNGPQVIYSGIYSLPHFESDFHKEMKPILARVNIRVFSLQPTGWFVRLYAKGTSRQVMSFSAKYFRRSIDETGRLTSFYDMYVNFIDPRTECLQGYYNANVYRDEGLRQEL